MPIPQTQVAEEEVSRATEIPVWKRTLDLACLLLLLPATLVLMTFIAAVIKTVSRGPVFFKQERVGHRRMRFICFKFRSMKTGADTAAHRQHVQELLRSDAPMTKMDAAGDPRLIPFGAMLRAAGLDELPQLLNVWRGEMSLVGPRPSLPYEVESFCPWQLARFETPPGLTGLWQVSGKNDTTFTEMVNLDIHYARNKSLRMDLAILAGTFSVLVSQVRAKRAREHCATRISVHGESYDHSSCKSKP
jgi:lipopolysaccharide/colanic/teichoic acid biosynthesis glycosyltransferase